MAASSEEIKLYLPHYLSSADKELIARELDVVSRGGTVDFLLTPSRDNFKDIMLQGDAWKNFTIFTFPTGASMSVKGLVISNSCDVDPVNRRDLPAKISFTPLVKLSAYRRVLRQAGVEEDRCTAKIEAIKRQKTSNIFFIPAGASLSEDYIVRLDDLYSIPAKLFTSDESSKKVFTLSNSGFYLLVLKLSYHFCRLQEEVNRTTVSEAN